MKGRSDERILKRSGQKSLAAPPQFDGRKSKLSGTLAVSLEEELELSERIDLAGERLRGYVLEASDESFSHRSHLLKASDPAPGGSAVGPEGRMTDGWETRRRKGTGYDWAIVRLGAPGVIEELVVDTSHFSGNHPTHASVDGCVAPHNALACDLDGWVKVVPKSQLQADSENRFPVQNAQRFTHLRLNIFPDGGVARLRVMGRPLPGWMAPGRAPSFLDLASVSNGAGVHSSSQTHYGQAQNLIQPGDPKSVDDGWESGRRREPGHESVVLRLAAAGRISSAVLDTAHFQGNCPTTASLEAACTTGEPGEGDWFELLPPQTMLPHTEHEFRDELSEHHEVRWVRLNLSPDGGMGRVRLWGEPSRTALSACRLAYLNACGEPELHEIFRAVCHSNKWATELSLAAPYDSLADLQRKGASAWSRCREADWKESLAGHPRIGEKAAGKDLASKWSRGEQSKAAAPDQAVKDELRARQVAYEERFGFIFLICATGRSSTEILAALNQRMEQPPERELQTVAEELAKIIHLRLEKLIEQ